MDPIQTLLTKDETTELMPVLFVGHGNPMNALEENVFSSQWRELGESLPKPKAILCISAHWETDGTQVTAMEKPETIHDFGGFPRELFQVQYPAPGSPWLAEQTRQALTHAEVGLDQSWGLDHGAWSVLMHMYPEADVPVIQLSLDRRLSAEGHFSLGQELSRLRRRGVLVIGSGNMVHNLRRLALRGGSDSDFNRPYGLDWALEANELFKKLIQEDRLPELTRYRSLGAAVQLAVPTPEHFLPMLYSLALKEHGDTLSFFNDVPVAGSLTMTSFLIEPEQ